jgi:hypothetical protein
MEILNPNVPIAKVQKEKRKNAKKAKLFGDMSPSQIESFERQTGSIVLFDCDRGVNFQKCKGDDDAMVILIDGFKKPIVLLEIEINVLRTWLNSNFNSQKS